MSLNASLITKRQRIVLDLISKAADDATAAIRRVLALVAPNEQLPIALGGAGAALGLAAAHLKSLEPCASDRGDMPDKSADPEAIMLTALLLGNMLVHSVTDMETALRAAYRDLDTLRNNGSLKANEPRRPDSRDGATP